MNLLETASLVCAAILSFPLAAQPQMQRFPPLATSESPWNVLAFGGKGEMHGAPICQALSFFSSSPKALDFDADFLNEKPSDLTTEAKLTFVGTMSGRKIYELVLTVHGHFFNNSVDQPSQYTPPTLEALLVQRGPDEYCDIFENQYTYDPTRETNETVIVHTAGQELLKTYQTDSHTWILEYWEMTGEGPARLDLNGLYNSIRSGLPQGPEVQGGPLDLTDPELRLRVEDSHRTTLGTLDLRLRVQGTKIVIVKRVWTPD